MKDSKLEIIKKTKMMEKTMLVMTMDPRGKRRQSDGHTDGLNGACDDHHEDKHRLRGFFFNYVCSAAFIVILPGQRKTLTRMTRPPSQWSFKIRYLQKEGVTTIMDSLCSEKTGTHLL